MESIVVGTSRITITCPICGKAVETKGINGGTLKICICIDGDIHVSNQELNGMWGVNNKPICPEPEILPLSDITGLVGLIK